jgi:hypothetical protein
LQVSPWLAAAVAPARTRHERARAARLGPDAADGHARRALILYELANRFDGSLAGGRLAGRGHGPLFGHFAFDMGGRVSSLQPSVLSLLFLIARRIVHSPFGYGLRDSR